VVPPALTRIHKGTNIAGASDAVRARRKLPVCRKHAAAAVGRCFRTSPNCVAPARDAQHHVAFSIVVAVLTERDTFGVRANVCIDTIVCHPG
jgi:hypothetical protein